MIVRKSDNTFEEYNPSKVQHGICEAYGAVGEVCPDGLIDSLVMNLFIYDRISSREIRRQVEEALMSVNKKVARAYIRRYDEREDSKKTLKRDSDFIRDYINASNASSGSKYDSNANVENKNIVTLGQELHKGKNIQQNRYIMHNKIQALYSKKLADQYIKDLESHVLYKHDESGTPGYPYTYSAKETIEVKYNDRHLFLPFDLLWEIVEEEDVLVNKDDNVRQKYPNNLYVKDKDNVFTHVTVMTKKLRKRDLVRVKTAFGEDVVVTDNHPMIVNKDDINDTVEAISSEGCKQFKINEKLEFDGQTEIDMAQCPYHGSINHYIPMNKEFGYFVGFFIGKGIYYDIDYPNSILITSEEIDKLTQLSKILRENLSIHNTILSKKEECASYKLIIPNSSIRWVLSSFFKIEKHFEDRTLPYNFLEYNEDFASGLLGGIIDACGTINDNKLSIKLLSRAVIIQITSLLRHFGYGVENIVYNTLSSNNQTLWGVNCLVQNTSVKIDICDKIGDAIINDSLSNYNKDGETIITEVVTIGENDSFLKQNDFIYDITTETRTFALNNILVHNCVAITMYPFLVDGLKNLGGQSSAPTDLKSYCGEFINLVYSVSSQFMGAVATPEFLMYMDYFIRKDYGDDYLTKLNEKVELNRKGRTLESVIENCFQQVVHSMNMPAGNRGYQTVFWNIGYFDKNYFDGVFGEFKFPDGTSPCWETLSWLQQKFMKWFNEERNKYILTFPVETMAMLTDGHDIVDKEYADFTAQMWSEGHSFFCYLSDSPDSLSSCCFSKDQKTLTRSTNGVNLMTFEELYNANYGDKKRNLTIFHNGSWVKGKVIKLPNREMYKVITSNNKEFILSDNHINVVFDGEKETSELTTNDYLMFNTNKLDCINERDEHLTYEQGFVIGAFLGDGSFGSTLDNGIIYDIHFSQNIEKYKLTQEMVTIANHQLGENSCCILNEVYNNVYPLRISSKSLGAFIMKWTNWHRGVYAYNKELNLNVLEQSYEFRKGILDGWYNTDGGNSNRCYTSSAKLAESMEALITSLGMNSIINVSDRTNEEVVIRGESFNRNYPLYCVRWYDGGNKRNVQDIYKWKNNSIYFKIKSIEKVKYDDDIYCFEMNNADEPYFTLPNGLITHNCRLRNSLRSTDEEDEEHNHTTHQFSMGTASVATGSKSVMTINLNRVVQQATRKYFRECENGVVLTQADSIDINRDVNNKEQLYVYICNAIQEITERVHKYQRAFNEIIKDFLNANMLDVYRAGFIDMRKQYLTVGVNGLTDAAEFLGIDANLNDEYKTFVNKILETINICNRKDKTRDCMYNTEFVPAENLSNKNYHWDKKDGYYVSPKHIMYSSYFFNPEDTELSILDKMKLHGNEFVKYLDGGQAAHLNINEHLSFEQYRQLLRVASENGCSYFTFNCKNTVCNDCGFISKHTLDECPKCGSKNIDYLTRIIGYLKRVSSFNEARQIEEHMRNYNRE